MFNVYNIQSTGHPAFINCLVSELIEVLDDLSLLEINYFNSILNIFRTKAGDGLKYGLKYMG